MRGSREECLLLFSGVPDLCAKPMRCPSGSSTSKYLRRGVEDRMTTPLETRYRSIFFASEISNTISSTRFRGESESSLINTTCSPTCANISLEYISHQTHRSSLSRLRESLGLIADSFA